MFTKLTLVRTAAAACLSLAPAGTAIASEVVELTAGYSEVIRIDQPADIIIVGNDEIANASLATNDTIVVTGRRLGSTNLILLGENGNEILSATLQVVPVDRRPQFVVQLIAGGESPAYVQYQCGPQPGCAPGEVRLPVVAPEGAIEVDEEETISAPDEAAAAQVID